MPVSYRKHGRYKSYSETRRAHREMTVGNQKAAATQTTTATESGTTPSFGGQAPSAPNISMPSPSGKGGLVAFLATLLFIFATWDQLGSKIWGVIWGSDTSQITVYNVNWRLVAAGILFIIAMSTLASINDDMGNIMALSVVAMWLVWIIQPGRPSNQKSGLQSFFDWFQNSPSQVAQTSGTQSNQSATLPSNQKPQPKTTLV